MCSGGVTGAGDPAVSKKKKKKMIVSYYSLDHLHPSCTANSYNNSVSHEYPYKSSRTVRKPRLIKEQKPMHHFMLEGSVSFFLFFLTTKETAAQGQRKFTTKKLAKSCSVKRKSALIQFLVRGVLIPPSYSKGIS